MIKDMTCGKPWRVLLGFSLPILLSSVFQQLYNIIDSVIAGRCIDENALAAVGASYPITAIFMAFALGSSMGGSVVISQLFGAKKITEMKTAINTLFVALVGLSLILTVFGVFFCRQMLIMLGTPMEIMSDSSDYLNIYTLSLVFVFLYNATNSVFTALGDSKTSLILLIISSVGNVLLDLLFVEGFGMGVYSLALATLIAQALAAISATLILVSRLKKLTTEQKPKRFSALMLGKISKMAIPAILQHSIVSVGNLFIQSIINSFGQSAIIAGYSAAIKINTFSLTSFSSFASGLSNFTAQNIGAGNPDRVKQGFKAALIISEAITAVVVTVVLLLRTQIIGIFIEDPSPLALSTGTDFLVITAPFYVAVCAKFVSDSVIRGAGAVSCFMISTFADLIVRVGLAYILSAAWASVTGVWWSWPYGWVLGAALALGFYFKGVWKNKSIV